MIVLSFLAMIKIILIKGGNLYEKSPSPNVNS
ncbi:hypothetical protein STAPHY8AQ_70444 [Staphylococcus sp. 8AQ]|nr:hypothetical protein STAPHY8AQ_70444 [Staphylococcus sp. 8AQ]